MLVKFWDLDTRHCFKTLVSHRSEVNDLMLLNNEERLITGCHDNELRVFEIKFKDALDVEETNLPNLKKIKTNSNGTNMQVDGEEEENNETSSLFECILIGSIVRESKDPLTQLCVDPTATVFSSHSANEKHIELFKINTPDEIKKRLAKKLKKHKRRLNGKTESDNEENNDDAEEPAIEQTVKDEFTKISMLKTKHKIKFVDLSCEFYSSKNRKPVRQSSEENDESGRDVLFDCKIACLLQNNQVEVYLVQVGKQMNNTEAPKLIYSIASPGHRTDVRTLCFSSDSTAFVSASGDSMKVWNRMSLNCIRSFSCDYALTSLFLSDDNHVLIGTKSGKIQLFNINAADMLENVIAHEEDTAVWSMSLMPDKVHLLGI